MARRHPGYSLGSMTMNSNNSNNNARKSRLVPVALPDKYTKRSSNFYKESRSRDPPPYHAPDYGNLGTSSSVRSSTPRQEHRVDQSASRPMYHDSGSSSIHRSQSFSESSSLLQQQSHPRATTESVTGRLAESHTPRGGGSRDRSIGSTSHKSHSTDRSRPGSPAALKNDDSRTKNDDSRLMGLQERQSRGREHSSRPHLKRSQSLNRSTMNPPISSFPARDTNHSPPAHETSLTGTSRHTTSPPQLLIAERSSSTKSQPRFPCNIDSSLQQSSPPTTSRPHRSTSPSPLRGSSSSELGHRNSTDYTHRASPDSYVSLHVSEQKTKHHTMPTSNIASSLSGRAQASMKPTTVFPESNVRSSSYDSGKRETELSLPESGSRVSLPESGGRVGLTNLGNTCFMNSMLQCLGQTAEMVKIFLATKNTQPLVKAYSELMQQMWGGRYTTGPLYPRALKEAFTRKNPQFSGFNQHDSQEFMRFLVTSLHEELRKPPQTKPEVPKSPDPGLWWEWYRKLEMSDLLDVFVGQLRSSLKCRTCQYNSLTFDPFWELSVSLPKQSSYSTTSASTYGSAANLHECLATFTRTESLDGDERPYCERCKSLQPCNKKMTIERLPPVLVIHLKRFSAYGRRSKLDTSVTIPHTLNVSKYTSQPDTTGTDYELYAVSNHSGTAYFGHYTAWCKHYPTNKWYSYNDSHVSPLTIQPSTFSSSTAYVLFYRQIKKKISRL